MTYGWEDRREWSRHLDYRMRDFYGDEYAVEQGTSLVEQMTAIDRLKRLKKRLGLTLEELALIFGVSVWTVEAWYKGRRGMAPDTYATLLRLECDNLSALAPKLRPDTVKIINEARQSGPCK